MSEGRRGVPEYILRSPFALEKVRYQISTGTIIYQSRMHPVLKWNFEVFSACDWLTALTAHIPNAGEHLVRYYGWYSNVNRGKRRKTPEEVEGSAIIQRFGEVTNSAAKRACLRRAKPRRARSIKQIYEVEPLVCPRCAGPMRIVAFIEQAEVIEKNLTRLGVWSTQAHGPPVYSIVA